MGNAIYRKDSTMQRIRNIRHKDSVFMRDRTVKYAKGTSSGWEGYPPSPELALANQIIIIQVTPDILAASYLVSSDSTLYIVRTYSEGYPYNRISITSTGGTDSVQRYELIGGEWGDQIEYTSWAFIIEGPNPQYSYLTQSNVDVYEDDLTTIYFANTCGVINWKRVNI